jgi:hypothetical protein
MKILIREDKRDMLAKKLLTKEFYGMDENVSYIRDGLGKQKRIEFLNSDGVIMIYGGRNKVLYICENITNPIIYFSYTPQQLKNVIGEWFSETYKLPVETVHHVHISQMN